MFKKCVELIPHGYDVIARFEDNTYYKLKDQWVSPERYVKENKMLYLGLDIDVSELNEMEILA